MPERRPVYPTFRQELDPAAPPEVDNQIEAFQRFDQAFNGWVREYHDCFKAYKDNRIGQTFAKLVQKVEFQQRQYMLSVQINEPIPGVETYKLRPSEDVSRSISLQLVDGNQHLDFSSYRLGSDGVVRRYDIDAETAYLDRQFRIEAQPPKDKVEAYQRHVYAEDNDRQNTRLEEDMGVNNQPVSAEEIASLGQFLDESNQNRVVVYV